MVRITLHGHRPACLNSSVVRSRVSQADAGAQHQADAPSAETAQVVNLFCIKVKIYRPTAGQASLLAQLRDRPPATAPDSEHLAHWNAWAQGGGATGGDRTEALTRMRAWLNQNRPDLPLSLAGLRLTSLPNLPASLEALDVGHNQLSELPRLPASLRNLNTADNRLTHLPDLPDSLERLIVYQNQLQELPHLPVSLRNLDASENQLTRLPNLPESIEKLFVYSNQLSALPQLPVSLKSLDAGENQLSRLPDLPSALERLIVFQNQLAELPDNVPLRLRELDAAGNHLSRLPDLPDSLERLVVFQNQLSELPENLPVSLRNLHVSVNRLTRLPTNLPATLEKLVAFQNQLSELPQSITQLSAGCNVDLSDNPIPQNVRDDLTEAMNEPEYQGPRFVFSAVNAVRPLSDAVLDWYEKEDQWAVGQTWRAFSSEENAASFSEFLDRLNRTVNAGHPLFKQATAEWLSHLANHPSLRKDTFLISDEATTSCEDRVSLTFNDMKKARVATDVARGDYDQRLPELVALARGMFRLDKLEKIAQQKAASLPSVDEIEVYLAYQVHLRERLDLPVDATDMQFFEVSCVTQRDLDQAEQEVRVAEGQEFADYLSIKWQPWQTVLMRLDPQAHAAAQDNLIEAMDERFSHRLRARLNAEGLGDNDDAQRILGPQVQAEMAREIKGPLTLNFLASQNLLNLLPPSSVAVDLFVP